MPALLPNQPCWIELSAPDPQAAIDFYGTVFGWEFSTPGIMGMGHRAEVAGHPVAGISPQPSEAPEGQPAFWSVYFRVADTADFLERTTTAKGQVFAAMPLPTDGATIALLADPTGTGFGVLEYPDDQGFDGYHGPGAAALFQLQTQDASVAPFYSSVFGWTFTPSSDPNSSKYQEISLPDPGAQAGMLDIAGARIPSHWRSYIAVDDVDHTARLVESAGGALLARPADTAFGRIGQFIDNQNAAFSVIQTR